MYAMLKILSVAAMLGLMSTVSLAQGSSQIQSAVPANAVTVTDWYKQNVYDPKDNKIGEVMDVLVDESERLHHSSLALAASLEPAKKMSR